MARTNAIFFYVQAKIDKLQHINLTITLKKRVRFYGNRNICTIYAKNNVIYFIR